MFLEELAMIWAVYRILNQNFPGAALQGLTRDIRSLRKLVNKLWFCGGASTPGIQMHSHLGSHWPQLFQSSSVASVGPKDLALFKASDGDSPQVSLAWSSRPSRVWENVICGVWRDW